MILKLTPVYLSALISSISADVFATSTTDAVLLDDVERIYVTATRQEVLDTDLAMSVHGVGKDALELDSGQHVAESLNSISGVMINQLSGGQGHKTSIRMPMNTSGYYLFLQDNIPLQSAAFFNHNALWWSSFNSNVARMEVLKGAGTALYGSGAVAGTVNVLSEDIAEQAETHIGLTLGQEEYTKIQLSHSDQLSDNQGLRVSGSYLTNEGWREHTGSERAEMTVRHELEINANEHFVTSFVMSYLEQEMAGSLTKEQFVDDITHSGLSDGVLASDPLRKTQYMRLSTQWDKISGEHYYSLIPYYRFRTNDYTATWNKNMPRVESRIQTLGLLALANIEHINDSNTTVGIDIEYTQGEQRSYQPIDITTSGRGGATYVAGHQFYDDTTTFTAISPYFQHKRELFNKLDLSVGARYDYTKYDYDNHLGRYGDIGYGGFSIENTRDVLNNFSPKASLNYHLSPNSSLYARYANSFRLPTASSLYHLTTADDNTAKAVDPEISDTYELGYKANWHSLIFDAALYYMDVDDGIVAAYNDKGQRYYTNATRVIHKGIELAVAWEINEEFQFNTAYSHSHHEFDDWKTQRKDFSGKKMSAAPAYITNMRLRYTPRNIEGFTAMLELQSIGEYWLDNANSQDEQGNDRIEKGYTLANIKFRYHVSKALSFNGRVLNIQNNKYIQESSYRYGSVKVSPGAPRTAYIGLKYQW